MVGYTLVYMHNSYRLWNSVTKKIVISRNVLFDSPVNEDNAIDVGRAKRQITAPSYPADYEVEHFAYEVEAFLDDLPQNYEQIKDRLGN
ncbi:hypothetical protein QE152_g34101 [Popillia japonica]|uniref:Retroviral polymerase SH3-like domain-containing protein n=1 Tax=Popillia japonica TaxID=7064 RepID=A0AAW1IUK3_POPJA